MGKVWSLAIVVFLLLCQGYDMGSAESAQLSQRQKIRVTTLEDTADPPFDADDPCGVGTIDDLPGADGLVSLREAIIAANNTVEAQSIFIAWDPRLISGATPKTTVVKFDTQDGDLAPNPLPWLCGGNTRINGNPNITLDGSLLPEGQNGLVIASSDITIKGLTLTNFPGAGIAVIPPAAASTITNPTLVGNVLIGNGVGVSVSPVDVQGATITGLEIRTNIVSGNKLSGITVLGGEGNASDNLVEATIEGNTISGNGGFGIAVFGGRTLAQGEEATGNALDIDIVDNVVEGNALSGITVRAGEGNALANVVEAVVEENILDANGVFGIGIAGGLTFAEGEAATDNIVTAEVRTNTILDSGGPGIGVAGGQDGAEDNLVEVVIADNPISGSGGGGIELAGGINTEQVSSEAAENTLLATVAENEVEGSGGFGIGVFGGFKGLAIDNLVDGVISTNVVEESGEMGIGVFGGLDDTLGTIAGNSVVEEIFGNVYDGIACEDGIEGNTVQCTIAPDNVDTS